MQTEIDKKIFALHHQPIEIDLVGNKEKIAHQSELSEIFTKEELDNWIETQKCEEQVYSCNDLIMKKGSPHNNSIWYVSSGEARERITEYDPKKVDEGNSL